VEGVLTDSWLPDAHVIPIADEASVSLARDAVRREGARLGLSAVVIGALAHAASELGHNQLAHARGGQIALREIGRDGVPGLEIVAADRGEGILRPGTAFAGTGQSKTGLGVGLAGVMELADEVDVDVRLGEGSCVWARKFAEPVRRRREVGVMGRAHPLERVSGDHATFARLPDALVIAVADGLGHGPLAREASDAVVRSVAKAPHRELRAIVEECHDAVKGTRGAVMSIARIEEATGDLSGATVGNVTLYVCGPAVSARLGASSSVLGARGPKRPVRVEHAAVSARDVVIAYTDGITARASLEGELDLMREHPIVVAERMIERFAREDDDVLVLAAR
jgi:anti-sigma regulatory factor (Ser/Thr protein kinase)